MKTLDKYDYWSIGVCSTSYQDEADEMRLRKRHNKRAERIAKKKKRRKNVRLA